MKHAQSILFHVSFHSGWILKLELGSLPVEGNSACGAHGRGRRVGAPGVQRQHCSGLQHTGTECEWRARHWKIEGMLH